MAGFEPATFCSQSKHATKLRYIPSTNTLYKKIRNSFILLFDIFKSSSELNEGNQINKKLIWHF